ncbi:hypothetical protein DM01DRAFT_300244 [Hesseltinella vesiculosa]|uniref:Pentatricopeptide repeat-containing protein-mitochondrial domain-containing protein n=1 Tax=Hesseltinella vesiculosa TaxID=101127 RepID=A0A1X2GR66_9FUNG|nr:hypothetical protein DM01DRAFT_300244 [Hesseltinella vesiculosa]
MSDLDNPAKLERSRSILQQLDASNLKPNLSIYDRLLDVHGSQKDPSVMLTLFDLMAQHNVDPPLDFYHRALHFSGRNANCVVQAQLLDLMDQRQLPYTITTYEYMIRCAAKNIELERALDILDRMVQQDMVPTESSIFVALLLAIDLREPREADRLWQLAHRFHPTSPSMATHALSVLRLAAYLDQYELVRTYWRLVVTENNRVVDDGLGNLAIMTAARAKDAQLSYDIMLHLAENGFRLTEHHFSCLLDAFASTLDMNHTFRVFEAMRTARIPVTKATGVSVARRLGSDVNAIHLARQALQDIYTQFGCVDIMAFNIVIHAFAHHGDLDEALRTYDMAADLAIVPDIDTLEALLDACVHSRNADKGTALFHEFLQQKKLEPSTSTLSKMIVLVCTEHSNYEAAFTYLEQIKKRGQLPYRGAYYRLVKKLAACDDPRLALAVKDMEACGYTLSTHLQAYIADKASLSEKRRALASSQPTVVSST